MELRDILRDSIKLIKEQGWSLPDNIKIKTSNDYYDDKPFSPSYVDRDTNTVYVMSSIKDEDTAKRLVIHELIHLTDPENYSHKGGFEKKTNELNKKYHLNLPMAAEDLLNNRKTFIDNPGLKRQAYKIVSNNSKIPIDELTDKMVYKGIPNKLLKEEYFPY